MPPSTRGKGKEEVLVRLENKSVPDFVPYDVETGILTGKVVERQRDLLTHESKYRLRGKALAGDPIEMLVKLSATGKLVIITLYAP